MRAFPINADQNLASVLSEGKDTGANDIDLANNQSLEFQGTGSSIKFASGNQIKNFSDTVRSSPVTAIDGITASDGTYTALLGTDMAAGGFVGFSTKFPFLNIESYLFALPFSNVFGNQATSARSEVTVGSSTGVGVAASKTSLLPFTANLLTENLSANREVQFPNKNGTIAFTSDILGSIPTVMAISSLRI